MYKVTKLAEGKEPIPGAPAFADLSDKEFELAEKAYEALGYPRHSLRDSGYWEHVEDPVKREP